MYGFDAAKNFCCDTCQTKNAAKFSLAKKSSVDSNRFRDYASNSINRCAQPWASIHGTKFNGATNRKFARVRAYLGVECAFEIQHYNFYSKESKKQRGDDILSSNSYIPQSDEATKNPESYTD